MKENEEKLYKMNIEIRRYSKIQRMVNYCTIGEKVSKINTKSVSEETISEVSLQGGGKFQFRKRQAPRSTVHILCIHMYIHSICIANVYVHISARRIFKT